MAIVVHGVFNGQTISTQEEAAFNRAIFGDMFVCLGESPKKTISYKSVTLSPFRVMIYGYEIELDESITFYSPQNGIYAKAIVRLTLTRDSKNQVSVSTSSVGVSNSYQFLDYQVKDFDNSNSVTVDLLQLTLGANNSISSIQEGWLTLISREEAIEQLRNMQTQIRDVYRCAGTMKFIADRVDPAALGWVGNWVKAGRMGIAHINDPTYVIDIYDGANRMGNGMNLNLWKCEYATEQSWVFQDNVNFMPDLIWTCFRAS